MKKIDFRSLGLFVTALRVSQAVHIDKAQAMTMEMNALKTSLCSTTVHGGGCACASCMQSVERALENN